MEKLASDGLICDIDGTLWDCVALITDAWNRSMLADGLDRYAVTTEKARGLFGKTMTEIGRALFPDLDENRRAEALAHCIAAEDAAIQQMGPETIYPEVPPTVRELSARIPLFIVSNCQCGYVETFYDKSGLTAYFRDFECFGQTGLSKAENIRLLCARNHLRNPSYIGDTQFDADACAQAGVPFIHAAYGFGQVTQCVARVNSFAGLLDIL